MLYAYKSASTCLLLLNLMIGLDCSLSVAGAGAWDRSCRNCVSGNAQDFRREGCRQGHRFEQAEQEGPDTHGDQSDEGASSPKFSKFQRGQLFAI